MPGIRQKIVLILFTAYPVVPFITSCSLLFGSRLFTDCSRARTQGRRPTDLPRRETYPDPGWSAFDLPEPNGNPAVTPHDSHRLRPQPSERTRYSVTRLRTIPTQAERPAKPLAEMSGPNTESGTDTDAATAELLKRATPPVRDDLGSAGFLRITVGGQAPRGIEPRDGSHSFAERARTRHERQSQSAAVSPRLTRSTVRRCALDPIPLAPRWTRSGNPR